MPASGQFPQSSNNTPEALRIQTISKPEFELKSKRQRKYTVEEFRGSARKGDFSEKEQANALD